ncbi:MAG: M1 family metallopeptidase [Kangiellaceae bacterium]|nr:M1 family metallopeptidase [Kangiellaceae bacterium]
MTKALLHTLSLSLSLLASTLVAKEFEKDWHTYANYQEVVSTHIDLQLTVDFDKKQLKGSIEHQLKYLKKGVQELILDTRDIDIHRIETYRGGEWEDTSFELADRDPVKGSKLTINLPKMTKRVKVHYNSRPEASGLQWLSPIQTAGKKHPFMFSQSQAIHARSWMPIQDTPAMRVTYTADVHTSADLRPIMSAENNPKWNKNGDYHFEMPQPIPTYLIAIAAGNIHYKKMSKQTAIYAEPSLLDASAAEFEDTQAMIEASERLYGKYRWTDYDLLILPPSFPFGGMENPRLSFITPTVIAGDKSLVSLIAHELAHSWSGNLVTNATWRDLWLNEGFTSYVENRIMEEVYGKERAVMEQALAYQDLKKELIDLPKAETILHVTIEGRDPDDAFSGVPYTKGQLFLMFLEEKFGRRDFDIFLKGYFDDHAFQSIDTANFTKYLKTNLINRFPGKVSMKEVAVWINEPMLPSNSPRPTSNVFDKVQGHMNAWFSNDVKLVKIPTKKWTVHEWLYFINNLPVDINLDRLNALDKQFELTKSTNNEIAHAWLLLNIKRNNPAVNVRLADYMISIGRRKLIVPLYKALLEDKSKLAFTQRIYDQARPGYHPLAQGTIDALFDGDK